jgi:DNA-binding cell septation regulator SpoVG
MARRQTAKQASIIFDPEEVASTSINMDLFTILEERRKEAGEQTDILHRRIGHLREELQKELASSHKEIVHEIREMKEEQRDHAKEMSDRVGKLEQWKWQAAGGFSLLAFLSTVVLPYVKDHM